MIDRLIQSEGEDRILLLSGGPKSHLATKSMMAIGMKKRVVITQPKIEAAEKHSPLNGETKLRDSQVPMHASLQEQRNGAWKVTNLIHAQSLDAMFRSLKPHTPVGSKWAGALSYDLVQWTQPIALQYPPKEGEILAILWLVDEWIVEDVVYPELPNPVRIDGEKSSHTDLEHANIVKRIKSSIVAGELYQLNFGRTWEGPLAEEPVNIISQIVNQ